MNQPDLFNWTRPQPAPLPLERSLARIGDPITSHRAAAEIVTALPDLEAEVLRVLRTSGNAGMTLDDICAATGLDKVTASPRLKPLEKKELVRRDGVRPGESGRQQTIWVAL